MKTINLPSNITRTMHKVGFQFKKHSPEILLIAGVVGTVASAVMACKATTKLSAILEETKTNIDDVHEYVEEHGYSEKYSEQDHKKDTAIIYAHAGLNLAKLYAPSVILGTVSIVSILGSHNILNKRNVALAAAYASVNNSFKDYSSRVIERFGKDLDRELRYNIKAQEIEETVANEDGTESTVKKTIQVADDPNGYSVYARFYDDGCLGWEKDAEHNFYFLKCQQAHANELLKRKGYLYLNEVYKMLGIPETKAGQVVGWIYDEKNPVGDNYVDFGIFDSNRKTARDFVNGYERVIVLDFNVDGNIWELMA